jgi:glycosyltransferase 2 family protein
VRRPELRNVLGLALSAVALAAVVWWARGQEPPEFPAAASDWLELAAAVGAYAVVTLVRGWRWHAILRHAGIAHRRSDAAAIVVVGYMGNTVLPARGGELLRIVLMGQRSDAGKREVLGSIVSERLLDAVALLLLFAGLTFGGAGPSGLGNRLALASLVGAGALAAAAWVVFRVRRSGRLERLAVLLRPFLRASRPLASSVGLALLLVTAVVWALEAVVFWFVARAVDVDVSFVEGTFLVVLVSFVMSVPAAPGYVGTFDAALLFGLSGYGVDGGQALAFALLWRFVLFVPITLAGLLLVFARYGGLSLRRLPSAGLDARSPD